ncbi:Gluconeogenesis factor [compost metagenome]
MSDHAREIERFAGGKCLDYVIYNEQQPSAAVAGRYKAEGAYLVEHDDSILAQAHYKTITGNFLGGLAEEHTSDILPVTRSLIRHDAKRVVKTLLKEYGRSKRS